MVQHNWCGSTQLIKLRVSGKYPCTVLTKQIGILFLPRKLKSSFQVLFLFFFFKKAVVLKSILFLRMDSVVTQKKVEAILNWPRSSNKTEVKSFLGIVNFYRVYITQCVQIAFPLRQLTKKMVCFKWDQDCEDSNVKVKTDLSSSLRFPYLGQILYFANRCICFTAQCSSCLRSKITAKLL